MRRSKSKTLEDMIREYASGTDNPRHQQVQLNLSAFKKESWLRDTQAMGQFNAVPIEWNMWTGKWLRKLELRVENHIDGIPNSFSFKHIKFL